MNALEHRPISIRVAEGVAVSGVVAASADLARPVGVVLGHGAGGDMSAPLLVSVADGLAALGVTTLRFNFPYSEKKRKLPDPMSVLDRCYRAAIGAFRELLPVGAKLVVGGKSMGGRVATMLAAKGEAVSGVLLLGYPLHPPKKKDQLRDAHLPDVAAPLLFFQGTRDPLCDLALLRPVLERLGARATLHVVEGGDHSLDVLKSTGRSRADVHGEVVAAADAWLRLVVENS